MAGLEITELGFAAVAGVLLGLVVLMVARRRLVAAGSAMVICSFRDADGQRWRHGLARFEPDALLVYSLWGLSVHPRLVVHRAGLALLDAREVSADETSALVDHPVLVTVTDGGASHELLLTSETCTAMRSWSEATPPGMPPRAA